MKKPTQKEISAEIKALRKMKPTVLARSAFGDDHHAAIDAQIETLDKGLSQGVIYDRSYLMEDKEDYFADNQLERALDARRWMDGEDSEKPSSGWKSLIRK